MGAWAIRSEPRPRARGRRACPLRSCRLPLPPSHCRFGHGLRLEHQRGVQRIASVSVDRATTSGAPLPESLELGAELDELLLRSLSSGALRFLGGAFGLKVLFRD